MTRTSRPGPTRRPGPTPRPGPRPQGRRQPSRTHESVRGANRARPARHRDTRPRGETRTSTPRARRTEPRNWLRPLARLAGRLVLGIVILAVFIFGVFPTGRYVDQREELDRATIELQELQQENERLQGRVERLESDPEIERVARDEYDMVYPGEEVYAVLPPG